MIGNLREKNIRAIERSVPTAKSLLHALLHDEVRGIHEEPEQCRSELKVQDWQKEEVIKAPDYQPNQ